MNNQSLYFFVKKQQISDTHTKYTYISTNPSSKMPYKQSVLPLADNEDKEKLSFGSLFEIDISGKWIEKCGYLDHDYELAVILGYDRNNSLLVYGNKIDEHIVNDKNTMYQPYKFFETGNRLLLCKDRLRGTYIIHNITKAILKYDIQKLAR